MKQTTKHKWFKQHDYGYGWTPIAWQGWLTLAAYVVLIVAAVQDFLPNDSANITAGSIFIFTGQITLWTGILYRICVATGGKPTWRWGNKK